MAEEKIVHLYVRSGTDFEGIRKIAEALLKDWVGSDSYTSSFCRIRYRLSKDIWFGSGAHM